MTLRVFNAFVTTSSIATIVILLGVTMTKGQERFGLIFLTWWSISVLVSLHGVVQNPQHWSQGDGRGILLLVGIPLMMSALVIRLCYKNPSTKEFLQRQVPLWVYLSLHVYRIGGLLVLKSFLNLQNGLFFQTALLHVAIGTVAMLLIRLQHRWDQSTYYSLFRFWNWMGMYDLVSIYSLFFLNFFGVGPSIMTDPPLPTIGKHPYTLIVLFQAPLAIILHLFLVENGKKIIQHQGSDLPLHIRQIRQAGAIVVSNAQGVLIPAFKK